MRTLEQITEALENLSDSELVDVWNGYCQDTNNPDAELHAFDDEFFEIYFSNPGEAARATFFGDIENWACKYVTFNGYGNLEAKSYVPDMISIYDLANHIDGKQDEYSDLLGDDDEE